MQIQANQFRGHNTMTKRKQTTLPCTQYRYMYWENQHRLWRIYLIRSVVKQNHCLAPLTWRCKTNIAFCSCKIMKINLPYNCVHETCMKLVFNNIKNWKTIANHSISQWLNQYFSMYETRVNMLHTSIISITVVFWETNFKLIFEIAQI